MAPRRVFMMRAMLPNSTWNSTPCDVPLSISHVKASSLSQRIVPRSSSPKSVMTVPVSSRPPSNVTRSRLASGRKSTRSKSRQSTLTWPSPTSDTEIPLLERSTSLLPLRTSSAPEWSTTRADPGPLRSMERISPKEISMSRPVWSSPSSTSEE